MADYKPRVIDSLLADKLEAMGAVLIEGPKFCGKTTTGEQQAKSILYMADPSNKERNLMMASTNIKCGLFFTKNMMPEIADKLEAWE